MSSRFAAIVEVVSSWTSPSFYKYDVKNVSWFKQVQILIMTVINGFDGNGN
jgi:hypothetical protein